MGFPELLWVYVEITYLSVCLSVYLSIYLSIYGSTALVDLGRFFSFLIYTQSVGLLGRGISPSQGRYLHRTTQTQNKRTQTSMPRVGFELTIPVFEQEKTVHDLDRAATVIGLSKLYPIHKLEDCTSLLIIVPPPKWKVYTYPTPCYTCSRTDEWSVRDSVILLECNLLPSERERKIKSNVGNATGSQ
jgi:hypothetical protein